MPAEHSAERRLAIVPLVTVAILSILLLAMVARVAQLQLAPSDALREQMTPRVSSRTIAPLRGDITDRKGRILSDTSFAERVVVDPTLLPKEQAKLDEVIVSLSTAMNADPDKVGSAIHRALAVNARREKAWADSGQSEPAGLHGVLANFLPLANVERESPKHDAEPEPASDEEQSLAVLKRPIRYVPVSEPLDQDHLAAVKALIKDKKLKGIALERQPVRQYPGGTPAASIVGLVGFEQVGMMGAEKLLDARLQGKPGSLQFVRDRDGKPLWLDPGSVQPPIAGQDVRLSIDLELQRIAEEELTRGVEEADAAGGRLVLIDPLTGEVLAICDVLRDVPDAVPYPWVDAPTKLKRGEKAPPEPNVLAQRRRYITMKLDEGRKQHPALGRNRAIEDVYEPGSTFKPFVWATITELALAKPDEIFDTEGGRWTTAYGRPIQDVTKREKMTWREVLINSSNIGMIKAAERMTFAQLHDVPVRFGFGRPTGIGVDGKGWVGEASGIVTPMRAWSKYTQTSVAYGHEIAVTPVQMVRAFSAFCRPGDLAGTLPQLRLTAVDPSDRVRAEGQLPSDADLQSGVIYRVLPPHIALLTRETMRGVADNMELRWAKPPKGGWRYVMFGKSGTAEIPLGKAPDGKKRPKGSSGYFDDQYNSSFVAGAPIENPRLVCIVVIDDPGPDLVDHKRHYGAATAGPVVRRVMERALTYLGVPPSPAESHKPLDIPSSTPQPGKPAAPAKKTSQR
jgi:cell division protein FtsI/penicillin-binding protein 2